MTRPATPTSPAALEEQLRWERRARALLQRVAVAAAEATTVQGALRTALQEVCALTGWPVGHVLAIDPNTLTLASSRLWHLDDEARWAGFRKATEAAHFAPGVGLPGRVLATRRPHWIRDVTQDANFPRAHNGADVGPVRAAIGVPVLVQGVVDAVLEFFSHEPVEPDEPLLEVMAITGTQLGRVIERTRGEEALRASELRFRSVAQTANDAIISADAHGNVAFWNHRAEAMFGWTEADLLGRSLSLVIPERYREAHERGMQRVSAGGPHRVIGRTLELRGLRRDGSEFPLELSLATWLIGEERFYTGIIRDVTERKESEERLQRFTKRLEASERAAVEASRAKSLFLASMSHELRTPLNAILGFVQLMGRDPTLTDVQREDLAVISRAGEHLLALINDVLSLSKIEAGEAQLKTSPIDLVRLLRHLRELFRLRAEARGLRLSVELPDDAPTHVLGDEGKLRQVLINLLSNAVKFTQKGAVSLDVRWAQDRASFEVEDTGPGIAAEELRRLFEPFVQASAGAEAGEGTGLGLAISRDFVRLMGGELRVQSEPGRGTRFRFEIPLPAADGAQSAEPPRRVLRVAPGQPEVRALVADDAADNRRLLVRLLASVGVQVREAPDGRAAVDEFGRFAPHIVWMDMRMPQMDGFQATRAIRALEAQGERPRSVILALTASAFEHDRATILDAGCDGIVLKPYPEEAIFSEMEQRLGVRFEREAARAPAPAPAALALADRLLAIAQEELAPLREALLRGDDLAAMKQAEALSSRDAELAAELKRLLKAFQIDELLRLLERAP